MTCCDVMQCCVVLCCDVMCALNDLQRALRRFEHEEMRGCIDEEGHEIYRGAGLLVVECFFDVGVRLLR